MWLNSFQWNHKKNIISTPVYDGTSVTRFGEIEQLLQNFRKILAILLVLFSIWQNFVPNLINFVVRLGNFSLLLMAKYWKNNVVIWSHWMERVQHSSQGHYNLDWDGGCGTVDRAITSNTIRGPGVWFQSPATLIWRWEVVVAQLVERSLPIPEVRRLNPVIGKNLLISNICIQSIV